MGRKRESGAKCHAVTYRLSDRPEAKKELEAALLQAREAVTEGRDAVQGLRSSTQVANDLARAITSFGGELAADQPEDNRPEFRVHVEGKSRDSLRLSGTRSIGLPLRRYAMLSAMPRLGASRWISGLISGTSGWQCGTMARA